MQEQSNRFELGIHQNVDISAYHSDREYISTSSIKEARKSLKHFHWYLNHKSERKSHFDFGNAFELALMDLINETKEFDKHVLVFDETKRPEPDKTFASTLNKSWKESFFQSDFYVINNTGDESIETMSQMLESCMKDETIQKLLKNTDYQTSIFWEDKKTGIKLKTRPDICKITKNVIVDVKTAKDASPRGFARDAANFDYPLQAAVQKRGCIESGLFERIDYYYWLVVEKLPPYNAQIYSFKRDEWDFVDNILDYTLGLIKQAREEDKFIGYTQQSDNKYGILDLDLPLYYRA